MEKNKFFEQVLNDNLTEIFVDTNFFIPPHNINKDDFYNNWIIELKRILPNMCIHESVKAEMVQGSLHKAAEEFKIYYNDSLNRAEMMRFRAAFNLLKKEIGLGGVTLNKNKGEIETLSFMYAKGCSKIITRDKDVIINIKHTSINVMFNGNYGVIHFYELLYLLKNRSRVNKTLLKAFYKAFYPNGVEGIKLFSEIMDILDDLYGNVKLTVSKMNITF